LEEGDCLKLESEFAQKLRKKALYARVKKKDLDKAEVKQRKDLKKKYQKGHTNIGRSVKGGAGILSKLLDEDDANSELGSKGDISPGKKSSKTKAAHSKNELSVVSKNDSPPKASKSHKSKEDFPGLTLESIANKYNIPGLTIESPGKKPQESHVKSKS
jgi:hypothetical protein